MMMSITGGCHRQSPLSGVVESRLVISLQSGRGIKNFDGVYRKGIEDVLANPRPEKVVRMRRNGQTARLVSQVTNFQGGSSFQVWQDHSDAEKVTFSCGYLNSRNN